MLPPIFAVLRRIGKRKPELVDMFRFRKNAEESRGWHWRGLNQRERKTWRVWVERYEAGKKGRRR